MSKHRLPPGGGAVPAARRDDKMSREHPESIGPWKGTWPEMMKRAARKKRRQRDRDLEREGDGR